jgi:hypothetical protein
MKYGVFNLAKRSGGEYLRRYLGQRSRSIIVTRRFPAEVLGRKLGQFTIEQL